MAQLDLKNCDVYFRDGYTGPAGGANAKINNVLADPVSAPTHTATGGGATGGNLAAGTYLVSYTFITALGETLRSPDSASLVVGSGNIPRVTLPALPAGATGINVYVSTDSGNRATETKYNLTPIVTTTFDLTTTLPAGAAPPSVSTAGLSYAVGATTITVDGITGALITGDFFIIGTNTQLYKITGHSETLGNTVSVTFTPGLVTAAPDNSDLDFSHYLQVRIGEGNISWTEKRAIMYTKDRGKLDTVRKGDEDPIEVKLDATWVFLKASTGQTPTIEDVLKRRGQAAGWVSSSSDPCEPYCIDIVIRYIPPCTTEKIEIYVLEDFRYEELGHDLKQGQLAVSGKCNIVEATVTRADLT